MPRSTCSTVPRIGMVYVAYSEGMGYKIGLSRVPKERCRLLGKELGISVELLHTIKTNDVYGAEAHFHQRFAECRIQGEWFDLAPEQLAWLKGLEEWNTAAKFASPSINSIKEWFTGEQAAAQLGVSKGRIRQLVRSGQLPAIKLSDQNLIRRDVIEAYKANPATGRRGRPPGSKNRQKEA